MYPNSTYFRAFQNVSAGGAQDFNGPSMELFDYTYQWPSRWSLNLSLLGAYYQKFLPSQTSGHTVLVQTTTVTPVYRLIGSDAVGAWQVYGGVGVGRYGLTARFDFQDAGTGASTTEIDTYTLGYQALIGAEYRLNEQAGLVIEEKFSRARIRFGRELARNEIDVGGHNILVGARIHF
jgi:opacity protein-like surface antigen